MSETVELTANVVGAFVTHNTVSINEMPELLRSVHRTLTELTNGHVEPVEPAKPDPAVPIKKSVAPDYLVCLEDGKKLKMLKRYLKTRYNMTPDEYRKRWGLPADYPMVAPGYSETRRELALEIGLGRKAA